MRETILSTNLNYVISVPTGNIPDTSLKDFSFLVLKQNILGTNLRDVILALKENVPDIKMKHMILADKENIPGTKQKYVSFMLLSTLCQNSIEVKRQMSYL